MTAGPTRESIDPVRYITNHSTGKMGYAIARVAAYRGADVTLVSGPVDLPRPLFVETVPVESGKERGAGHHCQGSGGGGLPACHGGNRKNQEIRR